MKQGLHLILALLFFNACAISTNIHSAVKLKSFEDVKKYVEQGKIEDKDIKWLYAVNDRGLLWLYAYFKVPFGKWR